MKHCNKCGEDKDLSLFCKDRAKPDGLNYYCTPCRVTNSRRWAQANPEKVKAKTDRYRAAHLELTKQRAKDYRLANPEKVLAKQRLWQQSNRDKISEYNRKRKAAVRGATGEGVTSLDWEEIQLIYNRSCYYCGASNIKLTQDHMLPISKGGQHDITNVVPACISCNCRKKDKTTEEFLMEGSVRQ